MYKILSEKTIFDDLFQIKEAQISQQGKHFRRICIKKEDAAAVLIWNQDNDKIVLTNQLRYPILPEHANGLLEIPAGKVDKGESPLQTAIREAEEEVGYFVKEENIQLILTCYPTPGYSSELFYIYFAKVRNEDKLNNGGGIDSENEYIDVVEINRNEFLTQIRNGLLRDGKTYLAALHLMQANLLG